MKCSTLSGRAVWELRFLPACKTRENRKKKWAFDMDAAMVLLREVTVPYPKSALFKLAAEGHTSVFEILVACIVSIRTFEETTLPVARRLFDNRITTRRTLTTTSAATLASRSAPF